MRLQKVLVPICKVYGNGSDEQVFSVQYTAETDGETCVENRKLYLKTQTGWAGSGLGWAMTMIWLTECDSPYPIVPPHTTQK